MVEKNKNIDKQTHNLTDDMVCTFCGKKGSMVAGMIENGNGSFICDECVSTCIDTFKSELNLNLGSSNSEKGLSEAELRDLAILDAMRNMPPTYAAEEVVYSTEDTNE